MKKKLLNFSRFLEKIDWKSIMVSPKIFLTNWLFSPERRRGLGKSVFIANSAEAIRTFFVVVFCEIVDLFFVFYLCGKDSFVLILALKT